MGVVYLAHNRLMGRDEVLKVMGGQTMERPGALDRFLREIRAVAQLRHPNIVTAYHARRLGESIVFAMGYVTGLDLSRMLKCQGPFPVAHACYFAHQAALGLQHAYEEGLVHRDIKPGNLMLTHRKDTAMIKILDFGLAKLTSEEKIDFKLTSEGQTLGTPDYVAPEQIIDAKGADIRSDIYSLGGTLYHLLTGRPPFQADSLYDMYQAHMSRDADLLNFVRPEVPAELPYLMRLASPRWASFSPLLGWLWVVFSGDDKSKGGINSRLASLAACSVCWLPRSPTRLFGASSRRWERGRHRLPRSGCFGQC